MQEHIFYRIISKSNNKGNFQASTSHQFHRSFPNKLYQKNQETSSVAFLSSLMQSENLIQNKLASTSVNFTTRQVALRTGKKSSEAGQRVHSQKVQRYQEKSSKKPILLTQTMKKVFKNQNALTNLVGELNPIEGKKENRFMEEMIHKARTFTTIPSRKLDALPTYKKRLNEVKQKQDFSNFVKKQDWKTQSDRKSKKAIEITTTQYINNKPFSHVPKSVSTAGDLYHFLKTENPKLKRLKTSEPEAKQHPVLSKRMAQMLLKSELKTSTQHFNLIQLGNRKSFKLKTTAS